MSLYLYPKHIPILFQLLNFLLLHPVSVILLLFVELKERLTHYKQFHRNPWYYLIVNLHFVHPLCLTEQLLTPGFLSQYSTALNLRICLSAVWSYYLPFSRVRLADKRYRLSQVYPACYFHTSFSILKQWLSFENL